MQIALSILIQNADRVVVEGYEIDDSMTQWMPIADVWHLPCDDDNQWSFKDQQVMFSNGEANAVDENGRTVTLAFYVTRPMTTEDLT